jgi:Ni,Fe-hydrogenase maturation factor
METGQGPVGSVRTFPLASLPDPTVGHSASAHDTSLINALRTAESLGADIPKRVDIVAVEAQNVYDFSEELSPWAAVPKRYRLYSTYLGYVSMIYVVSSSASWTTSVKRLP